MLRRQSESLEDFQTNVEDTEIEYNHSLIEIFGYPYSDDIGAGATYPSGYDGPDLYHYMYCDESALTGEELAPVAEITVTGTSWCVEWEDAFTGETRSNCESTGSKGAASKGEKTEDEDEEETVDPEIDDEDFTLTFHVSTSGNRFGLTKPASWSGERRAPGKIQNTRSSLLQTWGRFNRCVEEYKALLAKIENQVELVELQYNLTSEEITLMESNESEQETLNSEIEDAHSTALWADYAGETVLEIAQQVWAPVPENVGIVGGFAVGAVTGVRNIVRGIAEIVGLGTKIIASGVATDNEGDIQEKRIEKERGDD